MLQKKLEKQRDIQEQCLRDELQRALDKEVENQRREEKLKIQESKRNKKQVLPQIKQERRIEGNTVFEIPKSPPQTTTVYSPSFLERKKSNPTHYSAATSKSSLFWSLQNSTNIGSCDSYKPALVATTSTTEVNYSNNDTNVTISKEINHENEGSPPQSSSQFSSLSSSPWQAHIAAVSNNDTKETASLSSRTISTAPLSTATATITTTTKRENDHSRSEPP